MPQGLRVRVPLCAINLKTGRKSGFFNLYGREQANCFACVGTRKPEPYTSLRLKAERRVWRGGAVSAEGQRGDLCPRSL